MGREIGWPADWFRRIFEERHDAAISVDVISERDGIDPQLANRVVQIRAESRAISEILSIGDD